MLAAASVSLSLSACSSLGNSSDKSPAGIVAKTVIPAQIIRDEAEIKTNSNGEAVRLAKNDWFSFFVPKEWHVSVDAESDNEYKVYEFKIIPAVSSPKMASTIHLSYFSENNKDIATYQEFIRVNSQNVLRRGKTVEWEKYEPVSEKTVAGRKAFVVARNCRHFLHPNSKDDSFVMKKERIYVLPAQKGYYVIRYAADEDYFDKNLAAFEDIASSFKGIY